MASYHRNDGNKRAALIFFKDGVTTDEARAALESIGAKLDVYERMDGPGDFVQEYDPMRGSPVWYVP